MAVKSQFNVGILGATGAVGQKFIRLLERHPWFNVTALGASERSAGKKYKDAANWIERVMRPESVSDSEVRECRSFEFTDVDFVFSGLDSSIGTEVERDFATSRIRVISNVKNYRTDHTGPHLVAEVNP